MENYGLCMILEEDCTYPLDCETCPKLTEEEREFLRITQEDILRDLLEREEACCVCEKGLNT